MNYCDFLFGIKKEWLDNVALVDADSGRRFTYRQLQKVVQKFGNRLLEMGFKHSDVLTTHLYNSAEAVIAHLSIQFAGYVSCLLDPLITVDGLSYYLADTETKCLLSHQRKDILIEKTSNNLQIIENSEILKLAESQTNLFYEKPYNYDENELSAIFYTSGTTSKPKGVMLSPKTFFSHFRIFTEGCYTYESEDNLLCFVPFSHGYGSKSIFVPCIYSGATMTIMRSFHPLRVVETIENEKITHVFGVPSHYQQLLRRKEFLPSLKKLKAAFSAAALLKLETAQTWKEQVGYFLDEGYGLIETCTGVAFRRNKMPAKLGDIGTYPKDLIDIEIVDDQFNFLQLEEKGEIVIRGKSVMSGYLNKPEETKQALKDGWFRTGDMGYKNKNDEIILTGRIKDVINIAGIKVAPFEIEAVLNEHPSVNESAILGVEDEIYGEVVKAYVKSTENTKQDERELIKYLQKKMMSFQVPKQVVFVEEFPRNNIGKIDKKVLKNI
jgi:long-chain acyl-CoA synthetase